METEPVWKRCRRHRTPAVEDGFFDADYRAPPELGHKHPEEQCRNHMFRMCPPAFESQARLAYRISMAEGRLGKRACPHADS